MRTVPGYVSPDHFMEIVDILAEPLLIVDENWIIMYLNGAAFSRLFKDRSQVVGLSFWDAIPTDDGMCRHQLSSVLHHRKPSTFELFLPDVERWFVVHAYPARSGIYVFFRDVTEDRHREESLRATESSLAHAQRIARLGNWDWNMVTDESYCSAEMYRIFGYAPDEFSVNDFLKHLHPDDRETVRNATLEAIRTQSLDIEYRIIRKDGALRTVHEQGEVFLDEVGNPVRMIGTVQDITERREAEQRLHEIEQLYLLISENSQDIITITEPGDWICVYVSPAILPLLGYKPEDKVGRQYDYFHPDDASEVQRVVNELMDSADHARFTCRVRHQKGHYVWFETTMKALRDEHGHLKRIVSVGRDITERKQAEAELHRSKNNLAYAQRIAGIGHWDWDARSDVLYWSDEVFRIVGVNPKEFCGTGKSLWQAIHPLDVPFVQSTIKDSLASGSFDCQFRIVRPDGVERYVHAISQTIYDEHNRPVRLFGTVQDITERKQTEELLRKSEKLTAVGELAAGVAHEIRNPLTALNGFVQLLRKNATEEQTRYLDIMYSELKHIELITSELLVLAKPQADRYQARSLKDILDHVVALLNTQAIMNAVEIEMDLTAAEDWIECVENQIKQVFVNIIKNAIEAMPRGGKIVLSVRSVESGCILVEVTDQGVGIPEDVIPKLGEPFYSTKETGTGLGLMVTQRIIENHHGEMHVTSQVGVGTTVHIRLPLAKPRASEG